MKFVSTLLSSALLLAHLDVLAQETSAGHTPHTHLHHQGEPHAHEEPSFDPHQQTELEAVTVQGDPLNRSLNGIAQPVNVLTDEALDHAQRGTIGETLSQQPGIHNASYGAAVGRPVIRGLGGSRVKMMQNGIDSQDAGNVSPDHAVALDSDHADQIEILRGPAALVYGSDAIGGAVNVVDARIPLSIEPGMRWEVGADVSSVDEGSGLKVLGEQATGRTALRVSASQRRQADYAISSDHQNHDDEHDEQDGHTDKQANSDVLQQNAALGFAWRGDSVQMGIALATMNQAFGLPGHEHEEDHEGETAEEHAAHEAESEGDARVELKQVRADAQLDWQLPALSLGQLELDTLQWKIGVVDYEHTEGHGEEDHDDAGAGSVEESAGESAEEEAHDHGGDTRFERDSFESRLQLNYTLWGQGQTRHNGVTGIQISQSDFSAVGGEAVVPPTQTEQLGWFALQNLSVSERLSLDLAVRLERSAHEVDRSELESEHLAECNLDVTAIKDQTFTQASSSLGLVWHPHPDVQIRSSMSLAQRAPSAQELYTCGAHEATASFEIGNPDLTQEQARSLDLALSWLLHGGFDGMEHELTTDVNLYRADMQDFIYQQNLGSEIDGLDAYAYAQENALLQGYEANVNWLVNGRWQVGVFADQVRGEFTSGAQRDGYVPRMPADRSGYQLGYHRPLWHVYVRHAHYAKQDRLADGETATEGFDLVTLGAHYLVPLASSELALYAQLHNALDEDVRYHTSFVKDDVAQPGRNVRVGARYRF